MQAANSLFLLGGGGGNNLSEGLSILLLLSLVGY